MAFPAGQPVLRCHHLSRQLYLLQSSLCPVLLGEQQLRSGSDFPAAPKAEIPDAGLAAAA